MHIHMYACVCVCFQCSFYVSLYCPMPSTAPLQMLERLHMDPTWIEKEEKYQFGLRKHESSLTANSRSRASRESHREKGPFLF